MGRNTKFLVLCSTPIKVKDGCYYSYGPYIKELNIWFKFVSEVTILSPLTSEPVVDSDLLIKHNDLQFQHVPSFSITTLRELFNSLFRAPVVFVKMFIAISRHNHIHLRCPSNFGLLASMAQIFFPHKTKTVKYAGNWDPDSEQPWSYKLQQKILRNTTLSKNIKVLVYGNWNDKTENILPFFTASYSAVESMPPASKPIGVNHGVNLLYVGSLTPNKGPHKAIKVLSELNQSGIHATLDIIGEGSMLPELTYQTKKIACNECVFFRGAQSAEAVKEFYKKAHFLIFLSESEGWPKVIAESMFWGCVPITTPVSVVPQMVGANERGFLIHSHYTEAVDYIRQSLINESQYYLMRDSAIKWSRKYTLELFEERIEELILN